MKLEMRKPTEELVASLVEFIDEMRARGEPVWERTTLQSGQSPAAFVSRLLNDEVNPDPPFVPETTYWATIGDHVVGRLGFRHELNADLAEFGGHIGYEVRPSFRRQGIAKEMLRQVLKTDRARALGHLLLTCSPDNTASIRTIEANGGLLRKTIFVERINRETRHYWIDVNK